MTIRADGNVLVNALYHSSFVSVLAVGYAKMATGGAPPKLDFTPRDIGMLILSVALTMATKDTLSRQGIIPADIMKQKWPL